MKHNLRIDAPIEELRAHIKKLVLDAYAAQQTIQVYPVGFIRLPFTESRYQNGFALHVWLSDLPNQELHTYHTHIFHLKSRILSGRLINFNWKFHKDAKGPYVKLKAIYNKGKYTWSDDRDIGRVVLTEQSIQNEHDVYEIPQNIFHSTVADHGTVSFIEKSAIDPKAHPLIIKPKQLERIGNEAFDLTTFPQSRAWQEVFQAVERL